MEACLLRNTAALQHRSMAACRRPNMAVCRRPNMADFPRPSTAACPRLSTAAYRRPSTAGCPLLNTADCPLPRAEACRLQQGRSIEATFRLGQSSSENLRHEAISRQPISFAGIFHRTCGPKILEVFSRTCSGSRCGFITPSITRCHSRFGQCQHVHAHQHKEPALARGRLWRRFGRPRA